MGAAARAGDQMEVKREEAGRRHNPQPRSPKSREDTCGTSGHGLASIVLLG